MSDRARLRSLIHSSGTLLLSVLLRPELADEAAQILAELPAELVVLQTVFDRRLQVTELAAAVVALAFELVGVHRSAAGQAVGHPVSKLRRVAIGPLSDPKLTPGVWRELTKQEVRMLETMQDAKPAKARRVTQRPTSRKKTPSKKKTGAKPAARTASKPRRAARQR